MQTDDDDDDSGGDGDGGSTPYRVVVRVKYDSAKRGLA